MDFWWRLLNQSPLSSAGTRSDKDSTSPLHRFEKQYDCLLQVWRDASDLACDKDGAEKIEVCLQAMTTILGDENRRPLPHHCIQLASQKKMYIPIGQIASSSLNQWIVKEAVLFFATLIESEEEAFVEQSGFSASLTNLLVRVTGVNGVRLDAVAEARIVELAFNITTKIRFKPTTLPIWFETASTRDLTLFSNDDANNSSRDEAENPQEARDKFEGMTQRSDFPLFYILTDYMHHEGKVGDFARTGLLYLIESASISAALEQWIVESDLATLMATSLGALYSQLSRKLVVDHLPQELPPVLAFSDYQHPTSSYAAESSCSPEFQSHIDTFLSHLLFWQDVLNHCDSTDIKETLLEHFQVIFLQQLLYPSLLESSDVDGGSAVAVLTYMRLILECLDHPELINLILQYLLALPSAAPRVVTTHQSSVSVARKRKSMDLVTLMGENSDLGASPALFNLVDLISTCLTSSNQQTVHVTLLLLSCIFKRHHRYAISTLIRTKRTLGDGCRRTLGAHQQDVEYFMRLAGSIGGQDNFDAIYDEVVRDVMTHIESHPCSLRLISPESLVDHPASLAGTPRDISPHTICVSDPVFEKLLDILKSFFLNTVEANLSVTEAILELASCGYCAIEGWLVRHPGKYVYDDPSQSLSKFTTGGPTQSPPDEPSSPDAETLQRKCVESCRREPKWQPSNLPRLLAIVSMLCDHVARYRDTIPRFPDLLQLRREAFRTADTASDTKTTRKIRPLPQLQPHSTSGSPYSPSFPGADSPLRTVSPPGLSTLEGFAKRIFLELGTPSRSDSPRSREGPSRSPVALGRVGAVAPPLSSTMPSPRLPQDLRPVSSGRSSPHGTVRGFSPGHADKACGNAAGQAAGFAAADQAILARRVSILDGKQPTDGGTADAGEAEVSSMHAAEASAEHVVSGNNQGSAETDLDKSLAQSQTATVSHILTNTILLQCFLFELAALVQVRAGLFGEVRFV